MNNFTKDELTMLTASFGNHTRKELRGHLVEDFDGATADRLVPNFGTMVDVMNGEDKVNNLYGKLKTLLEEAAE